MAKTKAASLAGAPTPTPLVLPSRIEDSERDYLNLLRKQIDSLQASLQTFGGYLVSKYQIKQGESIDTTGAILRGEAQG